MDSADFPAPSLRIGGGQQDATPTIPGTEGEADADDHQQRGLPPFDGYDDVKRYVSVFMSTEAGAAITFSLYS